MKKFIAILLAVLTVLSATSMMVFAGTGDETTEKPFECTLCDAKFATQKELDDHYASTFPIKTHKKACEYGCGTEFDNIKAYENHLNYCTKKPASPETPKTDSYVTCTVCGDIFHNGGTHSAQELLADHMQAKHSYVCNYCYETFKTTEELKKHIDETFPTEYHHKTCTNGVDKNFDGDYDDEGEKYCGKDFTTKVAYEAHAAICSCKDTRSDADKMIDAFKSGNIIKGFEFLIKVIVNFIKSDEFKKLVDKVGTVIKGINFDKVIATVKDAASKIPFDKIGDLIKK